MSAFTPPAPLNPLTKARSVDINNLTDSISTAFAALPSDADLNNGTANFGVDSGTANTYVVTLPRTPTGYVDGLRVVFTPLNSNTGASTVNVNGLGVKSIRLQDNSATEPGTLVMGIPKTLIYGASLGNFYVEANSVTSAMNAASQAAASASAAAGSASAAASSASSASTSAAIATQAAIDSQSIQLIGTSSSSVLIGLGTKNYTASTGKQWAPGTPIQATDTANDDNFNNGTVTSYNPVTGALVMQSTQAGGSGTISSWNISVVGQRGEQGLTGNLSGGNLTGALNFAQGADVASAANIDPWSGAGNYELLTGAVTVTGFSAAPQAGSSRRVLVAGTPTLTASADLIIKGVLSGQSVTLAAGDEFDVYAETTTRFRVTIHKGDGTAMAGLYGSFMNSRSFTTVDVFVAPRTGWYRITAIGAGGRGAMAVGAIAVALGGASGGLVVGMRFLVAGQSYVVSPGSQTVAFTGVASGVVAGTTGGNSVFSGTGITTITASGGQGGTGSVTSGSVPVAPVGGTAVGGDINVPGASSGTVNLVVTGMRAATGGASAGLGGQAYPSGSITITGTPTNLYLGTGGAGIGGKSADISTALAATNIGTGGAGSRGPSVGNNGGQNFAGVSETVAGNPGSAAATFSDGIFVPLNATGGGSPRNVDANSGGGQPGGGSGAVVSQSANNIATGVAGAFAGSGALAILAGSVGAAVNGAGVGAGSGGLAVGSGTGQVVQAGGAGRVTIEW